MKTASKLEAILALPFDEYMKACWQHVHDKAQTSPIAAVVYDWMCKDPASIEATWAKRYWFCKAQGIRAYEPVNNCEEN